MDIRSWPLDRIMQLPDCAFGRRWEIIFGHHFAEQGANFYISDIALPDVCVLWELQLWFPELTTGAGLIYAYCSLALGDQVPTTTAEMTALETLLPGCQETLLGRSIVRGVMHLVNIRKPVIAQGRRVVAELISGGAGTFDMSVALVFSSIPKEVPDWLFSG